MADTSTDAVAPASVWVQLYYDNNEKSGEPFEIEPIPKNVGALKKDVIKDYPNTLSHADAAVLKVYAPDTTVPIPNDTHSLRPGEKVVKYSTTDRKPIIVIAPKPREQQNGKLRCCLRIHCCIQTRSNTEILCNYVIS